MRFLDVQHNQLVLSDTDLPKPNSNQCLVKVKAIGVNRADLLQKAGKYPPPKGESPILGLEIAGEIVKAPDCAFGFQQGDRVFGLVAGGGYAEFAAVNSAHLIKLPPKFSFEQGAAIAEVFLTAYQSLFTIARLKPKSNVLIHAGASGVGSAAIQLAKANNCFVVATTGSDEKLAACATFGADIVLNYHQQHITEWAKTHLPDGFNTVIDVVAGDYVNENINIAALDAHIVILSILGGRYVEHLDIARMLQKRITITASTLRNRSDEYKAELVANFAQQFMPLFECGELSPIIDQVYDWRQADDAHQYMAQNKNIGKLVLRIDG